MPFPAMKNYAGTGADKAEKKPQEKGGGTVLREKGGEPDLLASRA